MKKKLQFVCVLFFLFSLASSQHLNSNEVKQQVKQDPKKARRQQSLKRGGNLYEEYATALHSKRRMSEFTPAQWKTILLQKRIRIPLTAKDHHDLEEFFLGDLNAQINSGDKSK